MKHNMPSYEVENRAVEYTAVLQNILSENFSVWLWDFNRS